MKQVLKFEEVLEDAAVKLSPAVIANYTFDLAKIYNQFYHENAIIDMENKSVSEFRLNLSKRCAQTLNRSLSLLGIYSPEKM